MKKIVLLTLMSFYTLIMVSADNTGFHVRDRYIKRIHQEIEVYLNVEIGEKCVRRNYKLILTPVLYKGEMEQEFAPIVVETRRSRILDRREGINEKNVYGAKNGATVNYIAKVPYQDWMDGASLRLSQLACGCCETELTDETLGEAFFLNFTPYNAKLQYSYIKPEAEKVKYRFERDSSYVQFKQGQSVLLPKYTNNERELAKIKESIDLVSDNKGVKITNIDLLGTCSPEASWDFNTQLANRRVKVIKAYLNSNYKLENEKILTNIYPEDWKKFREIIAQSQLSEREAILAIIDSEISADAKDAKLSRMPVYGYLMRDIYPLLRKVYYKVNYTVMPFSLEQSKEVYQRNTKNLDLSELYTISSSYAEGTDSYYEPFLIGADLFPEDPTANINAAQVALAKGEVDKAIYYAERVTDNNQPEYYNLMGVLAMHKEQWSEAERFFQIASDASLPAATHNLNELKKKLESKIEIDKQEKTFNF
ncbi:MAG: tetratricopeptide repeat protein [Marinifilaceae bacterium]